MDEIIGLRRQKEKRFIAVLLCEHWSNAETNLRLRSRGSGKRKVAFPSDAAQITTSFTVVRFNAARVLPSG